MGVVNWLRRVFFPRSYYPQVAERRRIVDPFLGPMEGEHIRGYQRFWEITGYRLEFQDYWTWRAAQEVQLLNRPDVMVRVHGDGTGPRKHQQELVRALLSRSPEGLMELLQDRLAMEYERVRLEWDLPGPVLTKSEEVWAVVRLSAVWVGDDLSLGFTVDWENEHGLTVMLRDWKVREVALEG